MTKYYLRFNTMKYIMQAPESCSLEDALHIVCRAEEIACMQSNLDISNFGLLRRSSTKVMRLSYCCLEQRDTAQTQ